MRSLLFAMHATSFYKIYLSNGASLVVSCSQLNKMYIVPHIHTKCVCLRAPVSVRAFFLLCIYTKLSLDLSMNFIFIFLFFYFRVAHELAMSRSVFINFFLQLEMSVKIILKSVEFDMSRARILEIKIVVFICAPNVKYTYVFGANEIKRASEGEGCCVCETNE